MSGEELQRSVGRVEGELSGLKDEVHEIKEGMGTMQDDIKVIRDQLSQARGGWKATVFLGGAAATVGGLLVKFWPWHHP